MLKGIYGALIGMVIIMLVMYGSLVIKSGEKTQTAVSVQNPEYHLQLIVQNKNEYFRSFFEKGARKAESEYGVFAEFVTLDQMNVDNLREAVEMGVNEGVDAVALQAADAQQTQQIIEEAKKEGLIVLTYENNNNAVKGIPNVGISNVSLGIYAGRLAVEAAGGQADVAVIIKDEENNNLIIEGISDAFDPYSKMKILSDSDIYTIDADMFEAEKVASEIIDKENKPDLIICMDEKCTPGIAQILVDNNMVGDIKMVGYGITDQTLDYIEHGVIYGTICPDAEEIGYNTVKQMVRALNGEQISDYSGTGLFMINKNNVKEYRDSMGSE